MPRASSDQCIYKESGRRCVRNGTGSPILCRAHRIAFAEQGRKAERANASPARRAGSGLGEVIEDFFAGKPFDPSKVGSVINDLAGSWGMGGGFGNFHPDLSNAPRSNPGFHNPPPPNNRRSWFDEQEAQPQPPPGPDPRELQRARAELGFEPGQVLTKAAVADRRKKLARKFHPDLPGGSTERMMRINNAADVLEESLA